MPRHSIGSRLVLPLLAALLATSTAGAQTDAATRARELLATLAEQEAKVPAGRLTLTVADRRGAFRATETLDETARRLAQEEALAAEGTMVFGPNGWLKDLRLPVSRFNLVPARTRTAEVNKVLRTLLEDRMDNRDRRQGRVIAATTTAPGDAILSRRTAAALQGIQWSTLREEGEKAHLEGARGTERHILEVRQKPTVQLLSWKLVRQRSTPDGDSYEQTYVCRLQPGEDAGSLRRLEEFVLNGAPISTASHRVSDLQKLEPLPQFKPENVHLIFPIGTQVVDTRGGVAVQYEQASDSLSDDEILGAADEFSRDRVRPGQPAPDMKFPGGKGKDIRLADYRGKVLMLFWFAPDSRPSQAASPGLTALAEAYRSKGVQLVGLAVMDTGPGAALVDDYRKRHRWPFPVAHDPAGEGVRRFGTVPAVPKVAIIDRDGSVAYVQAGIHPDGIVNMLDALTQQSK